MDNRIISNPNICSGEPCIQGTRIPVQIVLSHLAAGDSSETVLEQFPRLTLEDIQACLRADNGEKLTRSAVWFLTHPGSVLPS